MGRGRKAMKPIGREIVQYVPDLAAILMTLKTHVATEAGPEPFDSIPRCAEEIVRHLWQPGPQFQADPIEGFTRPDPDEPALIDLDFSDPFHRGP